MNNKEIFEKITIAVDEAIKDPTFTLVNEDWGDVSIKCVCPLGCAMIKMDDKINLFDQFIEDKVVELFGINRNWIHSFLSGFDGGEPLKFSWLKPEPDKEEIIVLDEAFKFGKSLLEKYKPTAYTKINLKNLKVVKETNEAV